MEQQVIFSDRAYTALMTETLGKINTETGGIFLGHFNNDKWYIIESIDPGPRSIFSPAYFEYDEAYVNHLANKINRLYKTPLRLIGLWHRHPGSMDSFSSTDNETHAKFAGINPYGVLSALVNIDPVFRITMYSIPERKSILTAARKIHSYQVGDRYIPEDFISLNPPARLEKRINDTVLMNMERNKKSRVFYSIIERASRVNHSVLEAQHNNPAPIPVLDDDLEKIIEAFEDDFDFFEKRGISCTLSRTNDGALFLYEGRKPENKRGAVEIFMGDGKMYIRYNNRTFRYTPGLFAAVSKRSSVLGLGVMA